MLNHLYKNPLSSCLWASGTAKETFLRGEGENQKDSAQNYIQFIRHVYLQQDLHHTVHQWTHISL
jgi:hypothetical protein